MIDGEPWLMAAQLIGAVDRGRLRHPVANVAAERDAITRALDLLLTGL